MSGRSSLSGIGSIEKTGKKNTWRIRVSLGKDPVTGKYRKSHSRTVHGTKSEAAKALMDYHAELMDPSAIKPSDITVGDYAARFHEEREHEFRSPLAWNRESYEIKWISSFFGAYRLQDLDTFTDLYSFFGRERPREGVQNFGIRERGAPWDRARRPSTPTSSGGRPPTTLSRRAGRSPSAAAGSARTPRP